MPSEAEFALWLDGAQIEATRRMSDRLRIPCRQAIDILTATEAQHVAWLNGTASHPRLLPDLE